MAGYWEDERGDRRRRSATAGSTPAISGASTRRGTCTWSGDRRTSSSTPTARTSTPTRSRTCTATRRSSRSCRWSACPTARRSRSPARSCPTTSTTRRWRARRSRRAIEEHFRKVSAELPFWKRVEDRARLGRASCRRRPSARSSGATSSPSSQRLRKKTEETEGALAAAVPRDERGSRLAAGHRRHRLGASARRRAARQPLRRAGVRQPDVRRAGERAGERPAIALPESVDLTDARRRRRAAGAAGARRRSAAARERAPRERRERDERRRVPRPVARSPRLASAGWRWRSGCFTSACWTRKRQGREPRPAAHQLHRRGQPLLAPGHGRHQGRAGRRGQGPGVDGGGRLLLPQPYRRAYFKHFTNLVPMERSGSIRKSMDTARARCCAAGAAWWSSPRGRAR